MCESLNLETGNEYLRTCTEILNIILNRQLSGNESIDAWPLYYKLPPYLCLPTYKTYEPRNLDLIFYEKLISFHLNTLYSYEFP